VLEDLALDGPAVAPNATRETRAAALKLIEGAAKRIALMDVQINWIRAFLDSSSDGFLSSFNLETEQIRLISLVYQESFLLGEPSFEDKLLRVACTVRVVCSAADVSLELHLKLFEAQVVFFFVNQEKKRRIKLL
jgi:hypothetical protein